ncbi:hypothetical protein L1887_63204 [Cichorium endivia]|nr:hypothetical protein L1887_63204 [Cichorium endivia]
MGDYIAKSKAHRAKRDASIPASYLADLSAAGVAPLPDEKLPLQFSKSKPHMPEPTTIYPTDNVMGVPGKGALARGRGDHPRRRSTSCWICCARASSPRFAPPRPSCVGRCWRTSSPTAARTSLSIFDIKDTEMTMGYVGWIGRVAKSQQRDHGRDSACGRCAVCAHLDPTEPDAVRDAQPTSTDAPSAPLQPQLHARRKQRRRGRPRRHARQPTRPGHGHWRLGACAFGVQRAVGHASIDASYALSGGSQQLSRPGERQFCHRTAHPHSLEGVVTSMARRAGRASVGAGPDPRLDAVQRRCLCAQGPAAQKGQFRARRVLCGWTDAVVLCDRTVAKTSVEAASRACEPVMYNLMADGKEAKHLSTYESWQVNREKSAYRKEYLDYWQATKDKTGTGRPVDAIIAPVSNWASCPHDTNDHVSYTTQWKRSGAMGGDADQSAGGGQALARRRAAGPRKGHPRRRRHAALSGSCAHIFAWKYNFLELNVLAVRK